MDASLNDRPEQVLRTGSRTRLGASPKAVSALVKDLINPTRHGRPVDLSDRTHALREMADRGAISVSGPLLGSLLRLDNKPYTLNDHAPFNPLYRALLPTRMTLGTGRQTGKCVRISEDNRVTLATGQQVSGRELAVGDRVAAFDDFQATTSRVIAKIDVGVRQGLQITTRLGTTIEVAPTHPLRCVDGWRQSSVLKVGDRIAAARLAGQFGSGKLTDRVLLTAYMLGDGCYGLSGNWNFTAAPGPAMDEFIRLANRHERQGVRVSEKDGTTTLSANLHWDNDILRWSRADGLADKGAGDKFLPKWVFSLSRRAAAAFVARLWATDGWLAVAKNGRPDIGYCTISRRLAYDLRALLTKFGIPAGIRQKPSAYTDQETGVRVECADAYILEIETRDGWRRFMRAFSVPGKPPVAIPQSVENNNRDTIPTDVRELVAELADADGVSLHRHGLRRKPKYAMTYGTLAKYIAFFRRYRAAHPRLPELEALASDHVIWDEIEIIEPMGPIRCWDIEVEHQHNYVLNGLLSHNSTNVAARGIVASLGIPNFKTLFVTPLYEQIRRFSNNYVRPFINQSPCKAQWVNTTTEQSVLQRSFRNGSLMLFSFALLDADRIRGVSSHCVCIDEIQDMDPAHIPIINETLTASKHYGLSVYTGTHKTLSSALYGCWQDSSQAEWIIPCLSPGCKTENVPSKEFHAERMIGPVHRHISEKYPGVVCRKCRRPLNPRIGMWRHRYNERRWTHAGYHIPQIILPLHYASEEKWSQIIRKKTGGVAENIFWNEVMGEAVDVGQRLVTETQLKAACKLPWKNNPDRPSSMIKERLTKQYAHRVIAVDWGGGGEEQVSYTAIAVIGMTHDGKLDVLWGKRLFHGCDRIREAGEIKQWYEFFKCELIVHDFTGAGEIAEAVLIQCGISAKKIRGIRLQRSGYQNIMVFHEATSFNHHTFHTLDKARSLNYVATAIKLNHVRFFEWDRTSKDVPGLIGDFLALQESNAETRLGGNIYTIVRDPMFPDDFAMAVNLGICMLWEMSASWPDFAKMANISKLSNAQIRAAGNYQYGWDEDPGMHPFLGRP
jgi:hypothetical protein